MFTLRHTSRISLKVLAISLFSLASLAMADPSGSGLSDYAGPEEERWLAQAVREELKLNVGPDKREALGNRLEAVAKAWLGSGRKANLETANELVQAMRACKYLAVLEGKSNAANSKLAEWLLDHAKVRNLLFRALADVEKPSEALKQFSELQEAEPAKVLEYPNLAVAFATSKPLRYYKEQPAPASLIESFTYYANPKRRFRYDVKKMPYELSRYLANTRLNVKERAWAYKKYFRARDFGPVYFDVKYDTDHYAKNQPKKIAALDFTLPNLFRVGGVCIEQAYYASEVAKACGAPAAIVYGKGVSGIGHAWFTYFQLNPAGTSASWSGGAGRYATNLYFSGNVYDPTVNETILDTDLTLLGAAALLPLDRREQAEAATELAMLISDACQAGEVPADVEPLKALAADYGARAGGAESAKYKPVLSWVKPKEKLSDAMLEKLLFLAIQKNITYEPAWQTLVGIRKEGRISTKGLDRFFNVLIGKTAVAFPEQSCKMILELVPTVEEAAKRDATYKKSMAIYGRRPDLKGRILLAMGDDVRQRGQTARAILVYQTAAEQCIVVPDVVLPAAAKAEELLVANDKKAHVLRLYQKLFAKTTRSPGAALEVRKQTSNYKLGKKLVDLLKANGKFQAAEQIRASL